MSEFVKATEAFAWSGGLVHWGSELPADAAVVAQFPQFFEPVGAQAEAKAEPEKPKPVKHAPAKKAAAPRKPKAGSNG